MTEQLIFITNDEMQFGLFLFCFELGIFESRFDYKPNIRIFRFLINCRQKKCDDDSFTEYFFQTCLFIFSGFSLRYNFSTAACKCFYKITILKHQMAQQHFSLKYGSDKARCAEQSVCTFKCTSK